MFEATQVRCVWMYNGVKSRETGACSGISQTRPSPQAKYQREHSFQKPKLTFIYADDGTRIAPQEQSKREGKMKSTGLLLVMFLLFFNCASTGQSPAVGEAAPDFIIKDVSGDEVRLSDFKGKKSVVLVFYADSR